MSHIFIGNIQTFSCSRTVICIWTIAFHINYHSAFTLDNIPQLTVKMEYFMYQPVFQAYLYVDAFFVLRCDFFEKTFSSNPLVYKFDLFWILKAPFYYHTTSWRTKIHENRLCRMILWKMRNFSSSYAFIDTSGKVLLSLNFAITSQLTVDHYQIDWHQFWFWQWYSARFWLHTWKSTLHFGLTNLMICIVESEWNNADCDL